MNEIDGLTSHLPDLSRLDNFNFISRRRLSKSRSHTKQKKRSVAANAKNGNYKIDTESLVIYGLSAVCLVLVALAFLGFKLRSGRNYLTEEEKNDLLLRKEVRNIIFFFFVVVVVVVIVVIVVIVVVLGGDTNSSLLSRSHKKMPLYELSRASPRPEKEGEYNQDKNEKA